MKFQLSISQKKLFSWKQTNFFGLTKPTKKTKIYVRSEEVREKINLEKNFFNGKKTNWMVLNKPENEKKLC